MEPLKNLATVVTGATRGIGRATALEMAKNWPVLVVGRKESAAIEVCDEIRKSGGVAAHCVGNVMSRAFATRAAKQVAELGWQVQNLIVNAGISAVGATATFDPKVWHNMFATNVHGAFYFVQAFLPSMVARKAGNIVMVAGKAGVTPYSTMAAYCASKFALVGFAGALAKEVGKHGIRSVPLCPGPVDTDMTSAVVDGLVKRGIAKEEAVKKVAAGSGQKRLLSSSEVATKIAWICSTDFSGENGQPLLLADTE